MTTFPVDGQVRRFPPTLRRPLPRVRQGLLLEGVFSTLRTAILDGTFQLGERLVEADLAMELGTSRGPVRDALRELAQGGLVENRGHQGTFVTSLSEDDVAEIAEARIVLEAYLTRLAAQNATPGDLNELEAICDEMRSIADQGDISALVNKDIALHRRICQMSGNRWLYKAWCSLVSQIELLLTLTEQSFRPEEIVAMHVPLLESMRRNDGEGAEQVIRGHLSYAAKTILHGMAAAKSKFSRSAREERMRSVPAGGVEER